MQRPSVPRVTTCLCLRFQVLLGVVPLIFAYGMFGLAVFGYYAPRFGSFEVTYITLFSVRPPRWLCLRRKRRGLADPHVSSS